MPEPDVVSGFFFGSESDCNAEVAGCGYLVPGRPEQDQLAGMPDQFEPTRKKARPKPDGPESHSNFV